MAEEKKSLFGAAKPKPAARAKKEDKEIVVVPDMEQKLKDLQEFKAQISDLEALVGGITDELKTVAWDKFVELYVRDKANPNTFLIKDGTGCIMVLPTDKYISIKDEERADKLEKEYGNIITRDEKFYFDPAVLERNMETINKLLMDSPDITDDDKDNLLRKEVKLSIKKGTIDDLAKYGDKIGTILADIQPIMQLKNCGGAMAEGGDLEDGEVIYDTRDDYFRDDLVFEGYSNCCDAPMYGMSDFCPQCGEHCDVHKDQNRFVKGGAVLYKPKDLEEFWANPKNSNKTIFFVEEMEDEEQHYVVGKQTKENFEDSQYWDFDGYYFNISEAIKEAKKEAKKAENGIYVENLRVIRGFAGGGKASNERMYNFLKDDLGKLEKAINEGDKEEIDRFFSYWGYHLKSLKMASGGGVKGASGLNSFESLLNKYNK